MTFSTTRVRREDYLSQEDYLATGAILRLVGWRASGPFSWLTKVGRGAERATLTVVGEVCMERLNMDPVGNYNARYTPLKGSKFQLSIKSPAPGSPFFADFAHAFHNIEQLEGAVARTGDRR